MTAREFAELMNALDAFWGGVDDVREAGYRELLLDETYEDCVTVIRQMTEGRLRAAEDLKWLPKPPEVKAWVVRRRQEREYLERCYANAERLALGGEFGAGRQLAAAPEPGIVTVSGTRVTQAVRAAVKRVPS